MRDEISSCSDVDSISSYVNRGSPGWEFSGWIYLMDLTNLPFRGGGILLATKQYEMEHLLAKQTTCKECLDYCIL